MSENSPVIEDKSQEQKVSVWELIIRFNRTITYLFSRWKILLIAGIIGALLGLMVSLLKKVQYEANLTFVLEEQKSSSLGAYAGIAAQFGIDLGNSSSGIFSGDNIMEFLKSRLIVEHALLSDTSIDGRDITLADLYLDMSGLKNKWSNKPRLREINYPVGSDPNKLSLLQDSVIEEIYEKVAKNNLTVDKPDKKLGFIQITTRSYSELFSQIFTERLVSGAIDFYVKTKTQRSRANVNNLQKRADSILYLLDQKTYSLAMNQDLNQNPARKIAQLDQDISTRDKYILTTMYGEVVKNLEMAKMTLAQETPIIQIVDRPIMPLQKIRIGKSMGMIVGGVVVILLGCVFLLVRRKLKSLNLR
jgi:hypothetical protein